MIEMGAQEYSFKVHRLPQIHAASDIRELLDRLNASIAKAVVAGANVTIKDHEGVRRNVTKIDLDVWTSLI